MKNTKRHYWTAMSSREQHVVALLLCLALLAGSLWLASPSATAPEPGAGYVAATACCSKGKAPHVSLLGDETPTPTSTPKPGILSFSPSSATIPVGGTVTMYVLLSNVENIYGMVFRFCFDSTIVSIPLNMATLLWEVLDEFNNTVLRNGVYNPNSSLCTCSISTHKWYWYSVTNLYPAKPFTGTGRLASLTFQGLAPGTTALHFCYAKGSTRDSFSLWSATMDGSITVIGPTDTPTQTPVPTDTPTQTPTNTLTDTPTPTPTSTPTDTPTQTPVPTDTPTKTPVPTDTPTQTPVPTDTPTQTPVPTDTPTPTPVPTDTPTPTPTPSETPTPTETLTPTSTPTPTETWTPTPIPTETLTPMPTATPVPGFIVATVWDDRDGDGVWDEGEPPLQGALIEACRAALSRRNRYGETAVLLQPTTSCVSCITGADGQCVLRDLTPGTYIVQMTPPAGYEPTTEDPITVVLGEGATIPTVFGARRVQFVLYIPLNMKNAKWGFALYLPEVMKEAHLIP
nr:hypothetical protein [Chloroflexota bacterium]